MPSPHSPPWRAHLPPVVGANEGRGTREETGIRQLQKGQPLPVRVYQSDNRITVSTPMPGLEPKDIRVTVDGSKITMHGEQRGVRQDERDLLITEWEIGPSHRDLTLPEQVDGRTANASYGNGVLALMLPKATDGSVERAEILLEAIEPTVGMRIGHSGQPGAHASR
jgi:HSP20 family molecular chaperone IbpA